MISTGYEITNWRWLDDPKSRIFPEARVTVKETTNILFGLFKRHGFQQYRGSGMPWFYANTGEMVGIMNPVENFLDAEYKRRLWDAKDN